MDPEQTAENIDCPVSRKCKATMEGENYVVNCDEDSDLSVIEDNTDGIGENQNESDGSDTENS